MKKKTISRRGFVMQSALGIGGWTVGKIAPPERIPSEDLNKKKELIKTRKSLIDEGDILIENEEARLIIGSNAVVKSLVCKSNGEESIFKNRDLPISTIFQQRPYNNEIKLAHPCEEMTFSANAIRKEGNKLIIGYERIHYEAVLKFEITDHYLVFELEDFHIPEGSFGMGVRMSAAPVQQISFLQLPLKKRSSYGDWLQVVWDDHVATNLMAPDPFTHISADDQEDYYILKAEAERNVKLKGAKVCLLHCATDNLLSIIENLEKDFDLPNSVKSRKSKEYLYSYYFTGNIHPGNIDEHLKYAKMGGFRALSIYYPAFLDSQGYSKIGNYQWNHSLYPNGKEDFKKLLTKIKAAGLLPGYHFLHSHIGLHSKYITPIPDHRLNIIRHYTLASPLKKEDTEIQVDQNPENIERSDGRRVVRVGTELITYEEFTENRPFKLTGCLRGAFQTKSQDHPMGSTVGVLDVSEFGATSVYINQDTDLQEEVAEKIADIYDSGFEFCYFDGSEGVNPPFWSNIAYAQWKVFKKLKPIPLFAEGAAKTHFSWHLLSRGNAFDVFKPEELKQSIREHPAAEAPRMQQNFTHINFGWLGYFLPSEETMGTQPDLLEYASSRAAAWDCPISLQSNLDLFSKHPRTKDNLEVLRRWEAVRVSQWLTPEQKSSLKKLEQEHILLVNEEEGYELLPYQQIENIAHSSQVVRAFLFERNGANYVVYWHTSGKAILELPIQSRQVILFNNLKDCIPLSFSNKEDRILIPVGDRKFLRFDKSSKQEIILAFKHAVLSK